ncbi:MAG: S41 family peptidase [Candidatus Chaera renei]|uniref:S41 family peptidase n=1 Tax=Candidatus Chaera renei TaxID=2506947 RepID=A0A4V1J7N9_9BACT|nr:MAG: S41 family peptidase [Candidatus Chaera renei]
MESQTEVVRPPVGKRFSLKTLLLTGLLVAVVSFIGGTRAGSLAPYAPWLKPLLAPATSGGNLDLSGVQQVYDVLKRRYDGTLDPAALVEGAKRGLVSATGDPYTAYFDPAEAKAFMSSLEGKYSGVGAELARRNGQIFVVSVIDESPAKKAGLQPGDAIAKVNDQDATNWSVDKAVTEIRGPKGTSVKLTIVRGREIKEFAIVRDVITNPSVRFEITPGNIGILRISRFGETDTVNLARQAAEQFKQKNVKGVVVDLRGNGGGYLNAAKDVAGLWLNNKVVVSERRGGKVQETLKSGNSALLVGVPTVVLVDGASASASEILAGALKDNGAATLVGTKTFGKGSVQQIENLPAGAMLKVTVAQWYTPAGRNISKEGIVPDVIVDITPAQSTQGVDPQKDKAIELLSR